MLLTADSTVDLFIKTWEGDAKWLPYCLLGFDNNAKDFRQLNLLTDKGYRPDISTSNLPVKVIETDFTEAGYIENPPFWGVTGEGEVIQKAPRGPGYYWQQALKMSWPEFSDADAVAIYDTDTIAWGQFSFLDLTLGGRPYWRTRSYQLENVNSVWKDCVTSFLGDKVNTNYMPRLPFPSRLFTREATIGFAAEIKKRYGKSLIDFFRPSSDGPMLSEYSLFGAYLDKINRHGYLMVDSDIVDTGINLPDLPLKHYWSWGGLDPLFEDIHQVIQS